VDWQTVRIDGSGAETSFTVFTNEGTALSAGVPGAGHIDFHVVYGGSITVRLVSAESGTDVCEAALIHWTFTPDADWTVAVFYDNSFVATPASSLTEAFYASAPQYGVWSLTEVYIGTGAAECSGTFLTSAVPGEIDLSELVFVSPSAMSSVGAGTICNGVSVLTCEIPASVTSYGNGSFQFLGAGAGSGGASIVFPSLSGVAFAGSQLFLADIDDAPLTVDVYDAPAGYASLSPAGRQIVDMILALRPGSTVTYHGGQPVPCFAASATVLVCDDATGANPHFAPVPLLRVGQHLPLFKCGVGRVLGVGTARVRTAEELWRHRRPAPGHAPLVVTGQHGLLVKPSFRMPPAAEADAATDAQARDIVAGRRILKAAFHPDFEQLPPTAAAPAGDLRVWHFHVAPADLAARRHTDNSRYGVYVNGGNLVSETPSAAMFRALF
jgi:hypothetical protein